MMKLHNLTISADQLLDPFLLVCIFITELHVQRKFETSCPDMHKLPTKNPARRRNHCVVTCIFNDTMKDGGGEETVSEVPTQMREDLQ